MVGHPGARIGDAEFESAGSVFNLDPHLAAPGGGVQGIPDEIGEGLHQGFGRGDEFDGDPGRVDREAYRGKAGAEEVEDEDRVDGLGCVLGVVLKAVEDCPAAERLLSDQVRVRLPPGMLRVPFRFAGEFAGRNDDGGQRGAEFVGSPGGEGGHGCEAFVMGGPFPGFAQGLLISAERLLEPAREEGDQARGETEGDHHSPEVDREWEVGADATDRVAGTDPGGLERGTAKRTRRRRGPR